MSIRLSIKEKNRIIELINKVKFKWLCKEFNIGVGFFPRIKRNTNLSEKDIKFIESLYGNEKIKERLYCIDIPTENERLSFIHYATHISYETNKSKEKISKETGIHKNYLSSRKERYLKYKLDSMIKILEDKYKIEYKEFMKGY